MCISAEFSRFDTLAPSLYCPISVGVPAYRSSSTTNTVLLRAELGLCNTYNTHCVLNFKSIRDNRHKLLQNGMACKSYLPLIVFVQFISHACFSGRRNPRVFAGFKFCSRSLSHAVANITRRVVCNRCLGIIRM